jgi:2-keto-4-pentenoate hydratase/2-oxohepta-3-ene-1,7-dioic acid hydratase in catechol pathway
MRLATFTHEGSTRIGVVVADSIVDLSQAAPELPADMVAFLAGGPAAMDAARAAASRPDSVIPLDRVRLQAPVSRPQKFLNVGGNYRRDGSKPLLDNEVTRAAAMSGNKRLGEALAEMRPQGHQLWCNKQVSCITGPFDPIILPAISKELIYETELAVAIGRRCHRVEKADALTMIAGYLICNDVTVVDWSQYSPTVTLGKSFDTHGPIGPWIVTPDELGDTHSLDMRAYVNGEERNSDNTSRMINDCAELIAYLSQVVTLYPGDILTTGTASVPAEFLKAGDVVRCEIEGIGYLENTVVNEDDTAQLNGL